MKKKENEDNLAYVERILNAMMTELDIQGVALAFKTKAGSDMFTAKGNPPHFKIIDYSEWEGYWGE